MKPQRIVYRILFRQLVEKRKFANLSEGPLHPTLFVSGPTHIAPGSEMERTIIWEHQPEIDAGAVAFRLLQEVYHWFGISDDGIPYTRKLSDGTMVIDPEELIKAGDL